MDWTRIHEGIRRMRFTDILGRSERSELSQMEAAELLGVSERTFRRWRERYRESGVAGLDDRRLAPSPRRPMVGMMLHQDASTHAWLADGLGKQDLVVTMEDATSAIYSMFLVDEEGTASSLRGVAEVVARHGLFFSLYTDRGSHYFHTPEAGGRASKTVLTQYGIEHIAAYSPQARGRSERVFSTLQDRLPKEMKLAGIVTVEAANRWLRETYIPEHNTRFAIAAEQEGSAFVTDNMAAWRDILCVQEERTVGNDNTVKWQRLSLQLPPRLAGISSRDGMQGGLAGGMQTRRRAGSDRGRTSGRVSSAAWGNSSALAAASDAPGSKPGATLGRYCRGADLASGELYSLA